jgi:hypothetical protein
MIYSTNLQRFLSNTKKLRRPRFSNDVPSTSRRSFTTPRAAGDVNKSTALRVKSRTTTLSSVSRPSSAALPNDEKDKLRSLDAFLPSLSLDKITTCKKRLAESLNSNSSPLHLTTLAVSLAEPKFRPYLVPLIMRESAVTATATNTASSASGLGQLLRKTAQRAQTQFNSSKSLRDLLSPVLTRLRTLSPDTVTNEALLRADSTTAFQNVIRSEPLSQVIPLAIHFVDTAREVSKIARWDNNNQNWVLTIANPIIQDQMTRFPTIFRNYNTGMQYFISSLWINGLPSVKRGEMSHQEGPLIDVSSLIKLSI